MNSYHKEQFDAFAMVQKYIERLNPSQRKRLNFLIADYLAFRSEVDEFLMFLCEQAKQQVLQGNPALEEEWELIEKKRKQFT
jgi:hypothetical protein